MSTKCSQLILPQLGNRSSLNPSCFKEKQRSELDFPGAKVAGIPKSPIRVSVKNPKTAAVPCRTARILKERGAFPYKSGSAVLAAAISNGQGLRDRPEKRVLFPGRAISLRCGTWPAGAPLPQGVCLHKFIGEKGKFHASMSCRLVRLLPGILSGHTPHCSMHLRSPYVIARRPMADVAIRIPRSPLAPTLEELSRSD